MLIDADDLSALLDTDEFAVEALWQSDTKVVGIFEAEYVQLSFGAPGMEASHPQFSCLSGDVPGVSHGHTLRIEGTDYTVRGVQPEGSGLTRLILQKA